MKTQHAIVTLGALLLAAPVAHGQHHPDLKMRGAQAMGFDQDATTHHFLLTADGGIIDVSVKQASDDANRDAIRRHLKTIAGEFSRGDFGKPFATHAEVPPGVKTMQQRLKTLSFRYEDTADGARVVIQTADRKARSAVRDFLRYQIREHATGDPERIESSVVNGGEARGRPAPRESS